MSSKIASSTRGVLVILALTILAWGIARATTWTVCSTGCDFTSIQAAVDAAGPEDTIELGPGTFYENVVAGGRTILGAGIDRTIVDGGNSGPVFAMSGSLSDMTIQNGWTGVRTYNSLNVDNCLIRNNSIGVLNAGGRVTITTTTITGNTSWGVESYGFYDEDPCRDCVRGAWHDAVLTMKDSVIRNNRTGVLHVSGWPGYSYAYIDNTTISENESDGIVGRGTRTSITNSTASANGGYGAILESSRTNRLTNSTVSGNSAGGIATHRTHGLVTISNSTIYGNDGPGLYESSGYPTSYWDNFETRNTIVANNLSDNCWEVSLGHNISSNDCEAAEPSDMLNSDPLLLPLAENGGRTPTHALAPGSPAIDAGGAECEPTDQRGVPRPQDGDSDGTALCDIGAFELGPRQVQLDVKPGGFPNSINPYSRGVVPVAILGSDTFDVADVDVVALAFGPAGAPIAHLNGHLQDTNFDGIIDLMLHFRTQDTGIVCGDESATLTGQTLEGQPIEGSDSIQTVGCRETRRPPIWMRYHDTLDTSRRDGPVNIERQ
jgi:hypothetical protein